MSTPESKDGDKQGAKINITMAMDMLEKALPAMGSETPEGTAIIDVLKKLATVFGQNEHHTRELIPAEILQMQRTLPQAGGASPQAKAVQKVPVPGAGPASPM
jgi:hypothetical protein